MHICTFGWACEDPRRWARTSILHLVGRVKVLGFGPARAYWPGTDTKLRSRKDKFELVTFTPFLEILKYVVKQSKVFHRDPLRDPFGVRSPLDPY